MKVTSWCIRFMNNLRSRKHQSPLFLPNYLFANEVKNAFIFWTRHTQIHYFSKEFQRFSNNKSISNSNPLANLNIYLDNSFQCIRING